MVEPLAIHSPSYCVDNLGQQTSVSSPKAAGLARSSCLPPPPYAATANCQLTSSRLANSPAWSSRDAPALPESAGACHLDVSVLNTPTSFLPPQVTTTTTTTATTTPSCAHLCSGPAVELPSPEVRVSSYTRGDSPSRNDVIARTSKRGRSSSSANYLAPGNDDDNDPDDDDDDDDVGGNGSTRAVRHHRLRSISSPPTTVRASDGSWVRSAPTGPSGLDPTSRTDDCIPSIEDQTAQRALEEINERVTLWLSASSPSGAVDPQRHRRRRHDRRRARSVGDPAAVQDPHGFHIPGPGLLVKEESVYLTDEDETDSPSRSEPESPPATPNLETRDGFGSAGISPGSDLQDQGPLPHQFLRAKPWVDPPSPENVAENTRFQPETANAAMAKFNRQAKNIETASHVTTWGTRKTRSRSVSELDASSWTISSVLHPAPNSRSKKNGLFHFLPRRSLSITKRKHEPIQEASLISPIESFNDLRIDHHISSESTPQRRPSLSRSLKRSSRHSTPNATSAVKSVANQVTAIGAAVSGTHGHAFSTLRRRSRSRGDENKQSPSNGSTGLMELIMTIGGPPAPILSTPDPQAVERQEPDDDDDGGGGGDGGDEHLDIPEGISMEFPMDYPPAIPTVQGFKTQISQLNPRLHPALIDRFGKEQFQRYKKLVELKLNHCRTASAGKCSSRDFCFQQGGRAREFEAKTGIQYVDASGVRPFRRRSPADSTQSTVEPYPSGIPFPPVENLPAEFECPICFKVKKFQKPSDWTKHVHEDVQPFTCTFPNCPEPKSFKRKADWVRHESERHRQLEWWTCNVRDCNHKCYRRDNFIQHLVREHKLTEPKAAKGSASRPGQHQSQFANYGPSLHDTAGLDSHQIDQCYHQADRFPQEEPCHFCGNVLTSWKKLSVHMAKHMEQIALPVLKLVEQRLVSVDSALSPIEPLVNQQHTQSNNQQQSTSTAAHRSLLGAALDRCPVPAQGSVGDLEHHQSSFIGRPSCVPHPAAAAEYSSGSLSVLSPSSLSLHPFIYTMPINTTQNAQPTAADLVVPGGPPTAALDGASLFPFPATSFGTMPTCSLGPVLGGHPSMQHTGYGPGQLNMGTMRAGSESSPPLQDQRQNWVFHYEPF